MINVEDCAAHCRMAREIIIIQEAVFVDRAIFTCKGAGGSGQGDEAAVKSGRKTVHGDPP